MEKQFKYFVIFAQMRTGSNLLESNLKQFEDIECFGEAFNPNFMGYPNETQILGCTLAMRDADPQIVLEAFRNNPTHINGFRYFADHDPRVLDAILNDPACAKIFLYRNPVDAYVSLRIAQETGQWKLTNVTRQKSEQIKFSAKDFDNFIADFQGFYHDVQRKLQVLGQTSFSVHYDDLHDLDVLNGLGKFLGSKAQIEQLQKTLKRQNPEPLSEKVQNFDDFALHLAHHDYFGLAKSTHFEPSRRIGVNNCFAAADVPLLYVPIANRPIDAVTQWLHALSPDDELLTDFSQKTLKEWLEAQRMRCKFSVVQHPLTRTYQAFCSHILIDGPDALPRFRNKLERDYQVTLPRADADITQLNVDDVRELFRIFLTFIKANLNGQTSLLIDASWASQETFVASLSGMTLPDVIYKEQDLAAELPKLAERFGVETAPVYRSDDQNSTIPLEAIVDGDLQDRIRSLYNRDFISFGFSAWSN